MNEGKITILVVEDDKNLAYLLNKNLTDEGYEVVSAYDGEHGWVKFSEAHPDMCILDVMLPKQDGFTLAEMIRGKNQHIPILFLTAKSMKEDVYRGFEAGADDYITKPFTAKELLFRVGAILRRLKPSNISSTYHSVFEVGVYKFDYQMRELLYGPNGCVETLSTKESELLRVFCESDGAVINRDRLLLEVWGKDDYFVSKSLDVYITKLRKRLKADPNINIQNYHSIGYKMVVKQII